MKNIFDYLEEQNNINPLVIETIYTNEFKIEEIIDCEINITTIE